MDYSKLSDDDLLKLAGGTATAPSTDYSKMSDSDLLSAAGQPAPQVDAWDSFSSQQDTIQEQHEDVTFRDRLILKNLATSPDAMVRYLAKEHPKLEIVADDSGQIKMKRPGEPMYKVLDPDTGFFSSPSEMVQDVTDVGYDVLAGLGTSTATAAGGLAGAPTVAGALPAAALAGATTSAGLEGLRQAAGSAFGIEDNTDLGQVGMAGVTGALSPALFGTGATLKDVAGKSLTSKLAQMGGAKALTGEAAETALRNQSGVPGRLFSKAVSNLAPSIGGALSGSNKQGVMDMADNIDAIRQFDGSPDLLENLIQENSDDLISKITRQETKVYQDLTAHVAEKSGGKIDVKKAVQPFWETVQEAEKLWRDGGKTEALTAQKDAALNEFKRIWGKPKAKLVGGKLEIDPSFYTKTPEVLRTIKDEIAEIADYKKRFPMGSPTKAPPSDALSRAAGKAYKGLNDSIEDAAGGAGDLRKRIQGLIQDKEFVYKNFSEPGKAFKKFKAASGSKVESRQLAEKIKLLDKKYGSTLDKARGTANAIETFNKPIGFGARTLGGAIGGLAGYAAINQAGGQESFGGIPGYVPGMVAGAALTSPKMLVKVLEASRKTKGAGAGALAAQKTINDIVMQIGRTGGSQRKKEEK